MEYPIIPMHQILANRTGNLPRRHSTGHATFETELPEWEKWDDGHRKDCRLVALEPLEETAELSPRQSQCAWLGCLSPVSSRLVYAGVAEVSVYVAAAARGRGVGKAFLQALVQESEVNGIWTLQAGIFPENALSVRLHESCGFRKVGVRSRIGKLAGVWRDVLLLERRSAKVGR